MTRVKKELYRLPRQGKVAGVCAGIGEHFGIEVWLVRIIFITGLLLSGSLFFVSYVAAWFILDVKPGSEKLSKKQKRRQRHHEDSYREDSSREDSYQEDEHRGPQVRSRFDSRPIEVKEKVWQAGELPKEAVHDILGQYRDIEKRLQNLETYVTSTEFTVAREIDQL